MKEEIIVDLQSLGIKPTDSVMVHSSYKSLGTSVTNPAQVIDALQSVLSAGTLLLPALSYETVTKTQPRFSVKDTPICVGILPKTFRKMPGVVRSVHPTHSVCAYGKDAAKLTENHYIDRTPVGTNSPFRLLMKTNGKILMLGCGLKPNTFMHGVEETVGTPYVLSKNRTRFEIEYEDGQMEETLHITHDFKNTKQRYDRAERLITIIKGKVLEADACVIDAVALWEAASKAIKKDPFYFVD